MTQISQARTLSDKALLVLAAKAAGIKLIPYENAPLIDDEGETYWNPLTDDGDALRLAVKLELIVEYRRRTNACFVYHYATELEVVERTQNYDTCAATRRAIVRAAALVGAQM